MPLRLELKASAAGPGYGELTVIGWNQDADGIELSVQRNQDGRFLDEHGEWTTNPVWHDISVLQASGDTLSGEVGPWLVDPLMQNPQVAYMFELRSHEHKDKGVLRMTGQIMSSQAAGSSVRKETRTRHENSPPPKAATPTPPSPVHEPTPSPAPEPQPEPQPQSEPEPRPQPQPVTPRSKLPLILGLLALLLALGGGAAWFFLPAGLTLPGSGGTVADNGGASGDQKAEGPCGAQAMTTGSDLDFVQSCLKSAPATDQVLAVIEAAKQAKRCDIVQRLYAYKAQSGDARVALAYAREYDPQTFKKGGCVTSADAETASYWYEIVVANDATNTEAKQRLEQLGK
jgi:hypothetical protein